MQCPIDIGKKRSIFEQFIIQQNACEILYRVDSIGYVGLHIEKAQDALATQDRSARIYYIYPIKGGEVSFSNKVELGLALLKLRNAA
jgi:hypothetical protein